MHYQHQLLYSPCCCSCCETVQPLHHLQGSHCGYTCLALYGKVNFYANPGLCIGQVFFQVASQVRDQNKASFVSFSTPANTISFTITVLVNRALSVLIFKQLFLHHGLSYPLSRCQFSAPKPGAKRKHDNLSIAPQIPEVILQPEKLTYF